MVATPSQKTPRSTSTMAVHPRERENQAYHRAYLFGQFRFLQGQRSIADFISRRSKAGTLLKWFLLNPGTLVSADELIDLFWPETSPDTALGNLHVTIHFLRHVLEPTLLPRQKSHFIRRRANSLYIFHLDDSCWVDTLEVQQLFATARELDQQGYDTQASFAYRKAINRCSIGLLPECSSEEWLVPYLRRYEQYYIQALERMIHLCSLKREWEDMIEYAYQLLAVDPYHEPAIKAIVDAYLCQGQVSTANHVLTEFCAFVRRTMGIEPGQGLQGLRELIASATP